MVWQVLIEFAPHKCLSLSLCLFLSRCVLLPLSKRLVRDSPTAARGPYELLNQWWSPHKLSNRVSQGGTGQLSGYISSQPSVSVPPRPLYGSDNRTGPTWTLRGTHTHTHSCIIYPAVKASPYWLLQELGFQTRNNKAHILHKEEHKPKHIASGHPPVNSLHAVDLLTTNVNNVQS